MHPDCIKLWSPRYGTPSLSSDLHGYRWLPENRILWTIGDVLHITMLWSGIEGLVSACDSNGIEETEKGNVDIGIGLGRGVQTRGSDCRLHLIIRE